MVDTSKTVMIVEDEKPLQDAIKAKFLKFGFQTVTARSAEQAINVLKDGVRVDVIWLDHYLLGRQDGLDFVADIKKNEQWKKIPIFVVSNTATEEKIKTYLKLGVEKYYIKAENRLGGMISEIAKSIEKDKE